MFDTITFNVFDRKKNVYLEDGFFIDIFGDYWTYDGEKLVKIQDRDRYELEVLYDGEVIATVNED